MPKNVPTSPLNPDKSSPISPLFSVLLQAYICETCFNTTSTGFTFILHYLSVAVSIVILSHLGFIIKSVEVLIKFISNNFWRFIRELNIVYHYF